MNDDCRDCPRRRELVERLQATLEERNALSMALGDLAKRHNLLKGQRAHDAGVADDAPYIREWLGYWLEATRKGKGRKPDMEPGSDRWARTKRTLARRAEKAKREGSDDTTDEQALRTAVDEMKLAVDGILTSAWHTGRNPSGKRYLDVKNVLKDEATLEGFVADAERAQNPAAHLPFPSESRMSDREVDVEARRRVLAGPLFKDYDAALTKAVQDAKRLHEALGIAREMVDVTDEYAARLVAENADLHELVAALRGGGDALELAA